jgi:arylsulfatase A-like enzyme
MKGKRIAAAGLLTGLVAGALACEWLHDPAASQRSNLLLVTMDTTRADHTSVYGYPHPTTPTLEALAREGTLFEVAYATMSTTGPTHASLFTGLYPVTHGFVKNGLELREEFSTLAERLRDAGYQTAAVVSSFAVHRRFGFEQGFDYYHDVFIGGNGDFRTDEWSGNPIEGREFDKDAEVASANALEWLTEFRDEDRPFFLWLHYFDPHYPYRAQGGREKLFSLEGGYTTRLEQMIAHYDGEIREVDDAIASILAQLEQSGLGANTLIVIAADHGEGLMQHGRMQHGFHIYDESVRVPLIFRLPGRIPADRRIREAVSIVDVMPTILSVLQIQSDVEAFEGTDLSPLWSSSGQSAEPRPVFLQRRLYETGEDQGEKIRGEKLGIRLGHWKYIEAAEEGSFELFDLDADPGETDNLVAARPEKAEELAAELRDWWEHSNRGGTPGTVDPAAAEALEALGYVP